MIQANELRKGNKIIANGLHGGRIMTVDRLADKGTLSEENRPVMFEEPEVGEFLKDCKGVPLSPEILLASGFEYIKEKDKESKQIAEGYRLGSFFLQPDDKNRWIVDWLNFGAIHQRIYMREISSVHELQNLFFAIIGNELTINLAKVKV